MDARAKQMLDKYDKKVTQRLREAQREVTKSMGDKLEATVSRTEGAMASMLKEAQEAAKAGIEAAEALASSSSSGPQGAQRNDGGLHHVGIAGASDLWDPKTIEAKGICAYADSLIEVRDDFCEQARVPP